MGVVCDGMVASIPRRAASGMGQPCMTQWPCVNVHYDFRKEISFLTFVIEVTFHSHVTGQRTS